MCDPVIGASAGVGLLQIVGQSQQAGATRKHQQAVFERTRENASAASATAYKGYLARSQQTREAAALAIVQGERQRGLATSRARASQAGLAGSTATDAQTAIDQQALEYQAIRERNLTMEEEQLSAQMEAVRSQEQNRVLGALPKPVAGPDYIGILGNVATTAAGQWGKSINNKKQFDLFNQWAAGRP